MNVIIQWLRNQISLHEFELTALSKPYFPLCKVKIALFCCLPSRASGMGEGIVF